jgi:hypothetical protein
MWSNLKRWINKVYRRGHYDGDDPLGKKTKDEEAIVLPDKITTSAPIITTLEEPNEFGTGPGQAR